MDKPPELECRIFGEDWTIPNVAKLLRFNAGLGILRAGEATGGMRVVNQTYIRKASAKHLPSKVAVSLTREQEGECLHAAIHFVAEGRFLPWNETVAEQWLVALFGEYRAMVTESSPSTAEASPVRHFRLKI